jgi:hypothetical protein
MHADWLSPSDTGEVDEPTATSFAALARWKAQGAAVHSGRVL